MKGETLSLSDCTSGGCGAKIEPDALSAILGDMPKAPNQNLLVGYDSSDDAAVYQIDNKKCVISTMDFFSPMVDDPVVFGKIAAANALSDVYAMGGTPAFALNMICFPEKKSKSILEKILYGGAKKVMEAGAVIAGGHSIYDHEPKYGLSVTGFVDKDMIIRNNTPKIGDSLILTKPLGVGIVMAASRVDMASESAFEKAIGSMMHLNRYAAEKMQKYHEDVSACTDVTGFGFLDHLMEMCAGKVSAEIAVDKLPVITEAVEYAGEYLITAAAQRNRNHFGNDSLLDGVTFEMQEIMFDPQTSGGLLISVDSKVADKLLAEIKEQDPDAEIIGRITDPKDDMFTFI